MSDHLFFFRDLSPNAARHSLVPKHVTEIERQAIARVRRAKVKAPDDAIRSFVRSSGAEAILKSTLTDIRAVANAF